MKMKKYVIKNDGAGKDNKGNTFYLVWLLFLAGSTLFATILVSRYPPDHIDKATRQNIIGYIIVFYTTGWIILQIIFIYLQKKRVKNLSD